MFVHNVTMRIHFDLTECITEFLILAFDSACLIHSHVSLLACVRELHLPKERDHKIETDRELLAILPQAKRVLTLIPKFQTL